MSSRPLCRNMLNGTCRFGDSCHYSHDMSPSSSSPQQQQQPQQTQQPPPNHNNNNHGNNSSSSTLFVPPNSKPAPHQGGGQLRPSFSAPTPQQHHQPNSFLPPRPRMGGPSFDPSLAANKFHAPFGGPGPRGGGGGPPRGMRPPMPHPSHSMGPPRGPPPPHMAHPHHFGGPHQHAPPPHPLGPSPFYPPNKKYDEPLFGPPNNALTDPTLYTLDDQTLVHEVKEELLSRQMASQVYLDEPDMFPETPREVDNYHSLVPLDSNHGLESKIFLYIPTMVYKAVSMSDHSPVALRRMIGYRLTKQEAMSCVDAWQKVKHPGIVNLREVFTTKDFMDNSLVFVYDYHAGADTLGARHLGHQYGPVPEPLLWSYLIQLLAAMRAIHGAGLACRVFDLSKILILGPSRLLIGSVCIFDVLQHEAQSAPPNMHQLQQEDFVALGRVLLGLALLNPNPPLHEESLHHMAGMYSEELVQAVRYLVLGMQGHRKHIFDLLPIIGPRFFGEIDASTRYVSTLEAELGRELHNGRLFRLLSKLEFVVDAPRGGGGPSRWAETGDLYLLKLLRNYIFHQGSEDGSQPWIDLAHVVACLNKLDAGSREKVCLMSADEKNIMVVSYEHLKGCLAVAFEELAALSSA